MRYTQKVVIVGAGISGLACAHRLKQLGVRSLVLETLRRPGGVITTIRRNGYLFELGPQFPRFPASVWQLVRELGLEREFIAGDPKAKRYILKNERLHLAPFSPGGLLGTGLLSVSSKFRLFTEVFGDSKPPQQEESLAEFVQRKFGAEILENLVDPLIATVFFGDAYKMGMQSALPAFVEWERKYGSLVRGALRALVSKGARKASAGHSSESPGIRAAASMKVTDALPAIGSFCDGMGRLPERIAEELREEIRYGVSVENAKQTNAEKDPGASGWQLRTSAGENIAADALVLCVPAYEAARILHSAAPAVASQLNSIEYAAMHGVASVYNRQQIRNPLHGFGFMVPRNQGLRTICTFWNSSLLPGRASENHALITSFVRNKPGATALGNDDTFAFAVEMENAAILGITSRPVEREVWTNSQALPQYNVGHAKTMGALNDAVHLVPNLYLTGNYIKGRSIGDCVDLAFQTAKSIHSRLQTNSIQTVGSAAAE